MHRRRYSPYQAGVLESWFPAGRWSLVLGLQAMFMNLGAALTPPMIVHLMQSSGWRAAILWTSLPALCAVALWAWYGRNTPREHAGVSAAELAELGDVVLAAAAPIDWPELGRLLRNRNVLLVTFSYMCMNYVFYLLSGWCFLYLVQQRHFTALQGGWLAALPPLGAARRRTGRQHRCVAVHPLRTALGIPAGASRSGCPSPDCC